MNSKLRYVIAALISVLFTYNVYSDNCVSCTEYSQIENHTDCVMADNDSSSAMREILSCSGYTPLANQGAMYAPYFRPNVSDNTLYVRLNMIFIQKDDGSGNFQENDVQHQQLFDDAIADLNNIYAHLVFPDSTCYEGPTNEFISDAKIQFVDSRYYVRSSKYWNNKCSENGVLCPDCSDWHYSNIDDSIVADVAIPRGINIYFTEDSIVYQKYWIEQNLSDTLNYVGNSAACSQFPTIYNLYRTSRIHMPDLYSKYWWMQYIVPQQASNHYAPWEPTVYHWMVGTISRSLAHEIGHSFFLKHLEDDAIFYPTDTCKASIMRRSSLPRNFLPPNEIGRMYINAMTTNVRQFIPAHTYCGVKTFNNNMSFPNTRFYHSLVLSDSSQFTFKCEVTMPQESFIRINNNASCIIDGGELHSATGEDWKGIIVNAGGGLSLANTNILDYNIVVNDGGTIIVNGNLNIVGEHYIRVNSGGWICIDENASINLADNFSVIEVAPDVLWGCSNSENVTCATTIDDLTITGNGLVALFDSTNYIQNETITAEKMVTGSSVLVGYDVTNEKPYGDVLVTSDGHLRIKATGEVVLKKGVMVHEGGVLEIK